MKTLQQFAKFILYAGILVGVAFLFAKSGIEEVLDQHILLEYTHPAYFSIFSTNTINHVPYSYYLDGTLNKIVNSISTIESDNGFTVTSNVDGSLTFKGSNNSEEPAYVTITNSTWKLLAASYVLSDGEVYAQTGAPISTEDFKVLVMARQYHVGGGIDYTVIADASDPANRFFTTDYSQYNDYYVQLAIAPGYSSEGITVYPMLTTYEERSEDYQPAVLSNVAVYENADVNMTTYTRMQTSKEEYLSLSDKDRQLLKNYIRYQAPVTGVWTTIDFGDGTGLCFPENDLDQLQYGELNLAGQMGLYYGGEDFIQLVDHSLQETENFADYLQLLNNEDYTILVAVNEEGVNAITDYPMMCLENLGVRTELISLTNSGSLQYYQNSYYAVLNPGQESVEEASTEPLQYDGATRDGLHTVHIESSGLTTGEGRALIQIDGVEYSMNQRGMNIVVYDNATGTVVDNVTFDTDNGLRVYRELQAADTQ